MLFENVPHRITGIHVCKYIAIESHDRLRVFTESLCERASRNHHPRSGFRENHAQTHLRQARIEWYIRASRFHDPEQAHDQICRTVDTQSDCDVRPDAKLYQMMR